MFCAPIRFPVPKDLVIGEPPVRVSCDFAFSNYRFSRSFSQQFAEFHRYISHNSSSLFFLSPTLKEIKRWRRLPAASRLLGEGRSGMRSQRHNESARTRTRATGVWRHTHTASWPVSPIRVLLTNS